VRWRDGSIETPADAAAAPGGRGAAPARRFPSVAPSLG
jgi:hypothetical protein